ncbi:MAG: CopG family transcriptional regulator [Nautilia sp.]|nr:MAG: CopG family transcriptional regulator [Nautilia sp.]
MIIKVDINQNIIEELNMYAKELNEKKDNLIEKAIEKYFDLLDEQIAEKRLKELENGKINTIKAEKVFEELGI